MSIRNHNTNPTTHTPCTHNQATPAPEHAHNTTHANTPGTRLLGDTTATQHWKQHHPEHLSPTTITHTSGQQAPTHTMNNTGTPTIIYGNYTNTTPAALHALLTLATPWTLTTPFDTPTDTIGYLTNWTNNTPPETQPPQHWLPTPHTQPLILLQGPFEHWQPPSAARPTF